MIKTGVTFLLLLVFFSCSREPDIRELLLGNWRAQKRNVHTILTFRANGSWVSENKFEGRFSKIIEEKRVNEGTWELSDRRLLMTPFGSDPDAGWEEGRMVAFDVVEVNKKELKLKTPTGEFKILKRLRSRKSNDQDIGTEEDQVVSLGPLAVNLMKKRPFSKDRYLCVDMDLVLASPASASVQADDSLHPKIREAVLFYLSSQQYTDVNNFDKISKTRDALRDVLAPYLDRELHDITIKRIIITANPKNVEAFLDDTAVRQDQIEEDRESTP